MFELSVACKYLIPRRRQLSVSIISLISTLVIALVVWLIVVFFSVTDGLEKNWVQKLTALTAPLRITPTDAYYHSYYYLIDTISDSSNYSQKTIQEKRETFLSDPYNPDLDEEIPSSWPLPDRQADGSLKDLVKLVYDSLDKISKTNRIIAKEFEFAATHIHLDLLRHTNLIHSQNIYGGTNRSSLFYPAYLGIFEKDNSSLANTLLPLEPKDINNALSLIGQTKISHEPEMKGNISTHSNSFRNRLKNFFDYTIVRSLKTRSSGWTIPRSLYPTEANWKVCCLFKDQQLMRIVVPQDVAQLTKVYESLEEQGLKVSLANFKIQNEQSSLILTNGKEYSLPDRFYLSLAGGSFFSAVVKKESIDLIHDLEELRFDVDIPIQGTSLMGVIAFKGLEIADAEVREAAERLSPIWIHTLQQSDDLKTFVLPSSEEFGEGIALPKSFRDVGVMIGDRGYLTYLSPTASLLQEQQLPIYVAGFYDPGIIPIGGKFLLANQEVLSLIRPSSQADNKPIANTNGINVRFNDLNKAEEIKSKLLQEFKKLGITRYWNVETYREYEFTREIMHELQSQKHLFMLIAIVIIIVACSNIISMLVILVNDKKSEIGILRSMGATSKNIAFIFGICGALIGIVGSVIGIIAAVLTLNYLDPIMHFLSRIQGHDLFQATFRGQTIPTELSFEALLFVIIATMCISLIAGIAPAIKACRLRPSQILRSSGG